MDAGTASLRQIRDYYGRILQSNRDLETDACCTAGDMPPHVRDVLSEIDPEILERFYGCGSPVPPAIEGCRVLDLGCGTGRDAFVCARLAGERGHVIGIDMTAEQLAVAERHAGAQMRRFGLPPSNLRFVHGYMEDLAAAGVKDASMDVVISNCVINLSPDKRRVFTEIFRVLKPAGELLFADIFADRRVPAGWRDDPILLGECLAGAMYVEDFRRMLADLGVRDHRVVAQRPVAIRNPEIEAKVGATRFRSMTIRAFKLDDLEDRCEDHGQVATYLGTDPHHPHTFVLDDHHVFTAMKPVLVCGNTASMLQSTRFAPHFRVDGDRSRHFGLFDCQPAPRSPEDPSATGCC